jgi:dTDP-4-amino-4,6-dideoxygalactose transaminase
MTRKDFLIFGSPKIEQPEIDSVVESMSGSKNNGYPWIGTGPKVNRFENDFKAYIGTKYAMALNSCTAGLHLAMIVLGLKPGDEVITTAMTF